MDGQTGLLVRPGDPLARRKRLLELADDHICARAMGVRARAAALARYSLERMSGAYMDLYLEMLEKPVRPGS